MNVELYAIKDVTTKEFDLPIYFKTEEEAKRAFIMMCNDEKTKYGMFWKDMELYFIGRYNTSTGLLCSEADFIMDGVAAHKGEE